MPRAFFVCLLPGVEEPQSILLQTPLSLAKLRDSVKEKMRANGLDVNATFVLQEPKYRATIDSDDLLEHLRNEIEPQLEVIHVVFKNDGVDAAMIPTGILPLIGAGVF
jgi:hypothetical protein